MNSTLSPNSKLFQANPEKSSFFSDASQFLDKQSSSTKSLHSSNIFDFHSKVAKASPKFTPSHSKAFYSKFRKNSRFGRVFSTNHRNNPNMLTELNRRSSSAKRMREDSKRQNFIALKEKISLHLRSTKISPKTEKILKSQKELKSSKETCKNLLKKLRNQSILLVPQNKVKPSFIKTFTQEVSAALIETDLSLTGLINYSKFCNILTKLRFIRSPFKKSENETNLLLKAWRLLGGYDESVVQVTELHLFCLLVVNVLFRVENQIPTSPQNRKKQFLSMKFKDLLKLRQDFICFYKNRKQPQPVPHESSSEDISEIDSIHGTSLEENIEKLDTIPNQGLSDAPRQLIRKVSLKDLALMNKSTVFAGQSTSETHGNISFHGESDDVHDLVNSPSLLDRSICKIRVKRYVKGDEMNKTQSDISESVRSPKGKNEIEAFSDLHESRDGINLGVASPKMNSEKKRSSQIRKYESLDDIIRH